MEENLNTFYESITQNKALNSFIIIFISLIIYIIAHQLLVTGSKHGALKRMSKKSKTYVKMMTNFLRYVFIIVTLLILLQVNGVNVSSMLAGVGILSVIVGLAVQDALKDIIKGINILSDDYFSVGDIIKFNDLEGKVISVGLKTTKVQSFANLNIVTIANRNIEQVEVVSNAIWVDVPMAYEVPLSRAEKVVKEIAQRISQKDTVEECNYMGVSNLADSCIKYQLKILCDIDSRFQVRRDSLRIILEEFEKNNLEVPYNKLDVHTK